MSSPLAAPLVAGRTPLRCQSAIAAANAALTVPGGRDITLASPAGTQPMADLKTDFQKAAQDVMNLEERPDNDTMLRLYALYKQGSEGDVRGPKPGFFDFVGTAKYEAWEKLAGTAPEDAMRKYVDLVRKLRG
jgi:acyl-CoA-binding protein